MKLIGHSREIITVGDVIEMLKQVPDKTIINIGGMNAHWVYDEQDKEIYIDENFDWMYGVISDDEYEDLMSQIEAKE